MLNEAAKQVPMTLREKVLNDANRLLEDGYSVETVIENLCIHLEDTGAPAHMRVASELRGDLTPPSEPA